MGVSLILAGSSWIPISPSWSTSGGDCREHLRPCQQDDSNQQPTLQLAKGLDEWRHLTRHHRGTRFKKWTNSCWGLVIENWVFVFLESGEYENMRVVFATWYCLWCHFVGGFSPFSHCQVAFFSNTQYYNIQHGAFLKWGYSTSY